jgi:hypothetical protein
MMKPSGDAAGERVPSAIAGYDNMPGYRLAVTMFRELTVVSRRLADSRYQLDRALAGTALHALLATAEAGARVHPERRKPLYEVAWLATHDCDAILRAAGALCLTRPELLMAAHATVRETQQAVTIAAEVMARRQGRQGGATDEG